MKKQYEGKQKLAWASGYWRGIHDMMDVIINYDFFPKGMWDDLDEVEANASRIARDARAAAEAEMEEGEKRD